MGHDGPPDNACSRSACTECQRRKQKCNRVWPCNHCQKRKVADKCRFTNTQPTPEKAAGQDTSRKRQLSHHEDPGDLSDANPWDDRESGFEALGYTPVHLYSGLGTSERRLNSASKKHSHFEMQPSSCPQLRRALQVLPSRPCTDTLVQNFLDNVNYHYYIIYPTSFLDDYREWWASRAANKPLSLQWTCLLLAVCACSVQYTDVELQCKLEQDLGETTQALTEKYHNATRELHSVIPVGNNHLLNVQSLLHSCYWYASEARFVESWHVLSAAIREAQELAIHQEPASGSMSEFEREMHRRVWCILSTWDWQISSLLSRPMIIDRSDCQVGLPNLKLEGNSLSPLLHMKLLSQLISQIYRRFGLARNVISPSDVREYQAMINKWMTDLPPSYSLDDPDLSAQPKRPWIVLHRHYLHYMSFSLLLDPIRPYLARLVTANSAPAEISIRSDGIDYCLKLMDILYAFFKHVYPRDAKFHFVLFSIFDTAAVLCSALMHDEDFITPRRDHVLGAIDEAVAMLKGLNNVTKTAKDSYDILLRVSQRVRRRPTAPPPCFAVDSGSRMTFQPGTLVTTPPYRHHVDLATSATAGSIGSYVPYSGMSPKSGALLSHPPSSYSMSPVEGALVCSTASPQGAASADGSAALSTSPTHHLSAYEYANSAPYLNMTPPMEDAYQPVEFGNITQQELGDLASMWNYESLNLHFINPQS